MGHHGIRITVAAASWLLVSTSAFGWQTLVTGTPDPGRAHGVAIGTGEDVITGGRFGTTAAGDDALVTRHAHGDGSESWRRVLAGSASGDDIVRDVLPRSDGDVFAVGQAINTTSGADALAARLDAGDGSITWRVDIDGGSNGGDGIRTGALIDNDIVVVGTSTRPDVQGPFTVWRLDGDDGSIVWDTHVTGTESAGRAVVVGDAIYVAGVVGDDAVGSEVVVARLDPGTGAIGWDESIAGTGNVGDTVLGLALGDGGIVVALIEIVSATTGPDVVVVGLDATDGSEEWRATFDGDQAGIDQDRAWSIARDPSSNAVAVAMTLDATTSGEDIAVVKLNAATGAELWRRVIDGPSSLSDEARDVAVDESGDVVVAGRSRTENQDGLAAKLASATGTVIWERRIVGSVAGGDAMLSVAVDSSGNAAVGGFTTNGAGADEYTVALLSSATGGSFPCGDGMTDTGETCDDANTAAGDGCRVDCTEEVCGDAILDPGEACDGGGCCTPTCTVVADGTACEDGDACTTGETCAAGVCDTTAPLCEDADPCTVDTCTASGCTNTGIAGVRSASCVLDRPTIADACPDTLPKPIAKGLTRVDSQLDAAASALGKKIRTQLKKARTSAKKIRRAATKAGAKGTLEAPCAEAISSEMEDLIARIQALLAQP